MKQKYSDKNPQLIIRILNDNNPLGIIEALKADNIVITSRKDIKPVLFTLYRSDPKRWARVLKSISWNKEADNYTTNADFIEVMRQKAIASKIINPQPGFKTADSLVAKTFLEEAMDVLTGSSETQTTTTTVEEKPAAGSMTTKIIIGVVVFLVLGGIIYFVTMPPKLPIKA